MILSFYRFLLGVAALLFTTSLTAQSVQINEVVSSNSVLVDGDGDTPDWFELYNPTSNSINLLDWTITDDFDEFDKWRFPDLTLEGSAYVYIWASGKDKKNITTPRTLIKEGDLFRYLLPTSNVNNQWNQLDFDDGSWAFGESGFGYGDGDDMTTVPQGTRSVYLRKKFVIDDTDSVLDLLLDIDYDDAFVAYINGVEVARANINGNPPAYNATPPTDHEAQLYTGALPDRFQIDNPNTVLQNGENVLSIQAHNVSNTSSDMSIIPFLTVVFDGDSNEGVEPPAVLNLTKDRLHTNFKIASTNETLYLFDAAGVFVDSLQIQQLPPDISYGRALGNNDLVYFDVTTPGSPNGSVFYTGLSTDIIEFSHPGGKVDPFLLELSGVSSPATIRYTLDATLPNENSPVYVGSIPINDHTVVRARVFQNNFIPSTTASRTYLVDISHELPVVSLVTDPANFFDTDSGIYVLGDDYDDNFPFFGANFWEDWERPVHFTLYETDGSIGTAFDGGTKIFGGWSRGNEQRSLSIFARNQYGIDEINYPLFPNLDYSTFQALVLRNSGNDWLNSMMRDGTLTGLMRGSGLDYQAYRPAATYINGEYWGFYNMREKINEHFLASKHQVHPDDVDILEFDGGVIHGDNEAYLDLINFVSNNSLSNSTNYETVADQINIDNFIIYQAAQIYFNNTDWPGNNIKYWRAKNGKWRWILFDTDFGFGVWNSNDYANNTIAFALETNGPGWPNPPWSTLLFRRLVQQTVFKNAFINRLADELNSRFLPDRVCEHIDTLSANISAEISPHYNRWGGNVAGWLGQVAAMKNFAEQRPYWLKQHVLSEFNLPDYHVLRIVNDDPSKGYVKVNRLFIKNNVWEGDYFEEVPVDVVAIPEPGYAFSHWSGGSTSVNAAIKVNLQSDITLVPHFEPNATEESIVINEINYRSHPDFDTDDWIELYNPNPYYLDVSNWELKDDDPTHSYFIPAGTVIEAEGFLVITRDIEQFKTFYPDVNTVIGDIDFGLSSSGDAVRIYDDQQLLQDEVFYLPNAPWPISANGQGATLELLHPTLDNSLAESWANVHANGSPGRPNFDVVGAVSDLEFAQLNYFPNPVNDEVHILFEIVEPMSLKGELYDVQGRLVKVFFEKRFDAGAYELREELGFLNQGVYFFELKSALGKNMTFQLVKM